MVYIDVVEKKELPYYSATTVAIDFTAGSNSFLLYLYMYSLSSFILFFFFLSSSFLFILLPYFSYISFYFLVSFYISLFFFSISILLSFLFHFISIRPIALFSSSSSSFSSSLFDQLRHTRPRFRLSSLFCIFIFFLPIWSYFSSVLSFLPSSYSIHPHPIDKWRSSPHFIFAPFGADSGRSLIKSRDVRRRRHLYTRLYSQHTYTQADPITVSLQIRRRTRPPFVDPYSFYSVLPIRYILTLFAISSAYVLSCSVKVNPAAF